MFGKKQKLEIQSSHQNLFPSRVKDILINNNSDLFEKLDGWAGLGTIQFSPLYTTLDNNNKNLFFAKPLFGNIKQYPIKDEIVLILNLPSPKQNENENSSEYYYLNIPISFWNDNHHNAYADISYTNQVQLGNTFDEKTNIKTLLPEEGDIIIEGRWGHSIRFSSTTPNKENNNNSWSSVPSGNPGSPITIIRNNQKNNEQSPWIPIQEDINEDGSSIILSSDQEIPLNLSCNNLKTFNTTLSDSFDITLQIPEVKFNSDV